MVDDKTMRQFVEAVRSGDLKQLQLLKDEVPEILSAPKYGNWLHTAAPRSDSATIAWLINQGLDVDCEHRKNTPLCKAFVHENLEAARCLLQHGANPNCHMSVITPVNGTKQRPLEAIELLDEFGADLNRQYVFEQTGYPMTALSMARDNELHDVVKYLESRGCKMPVRNSEGD